MTPLTSEMKQTTWRMRELCREAPCRVAIRMMTTFRNSIQDGTKFFYVKNSIDEKGQSGQRVDRSVESRHLPLGTTCLQVEVHGSARVVLHHLR